VLEGFAGDELALAGRARIHEEEDEKEREEVDVHGAVDNDLGGVCVDARVGVQGMGGGNL
jgi:hypothetical protein